MFGESGIKAKPRRTYRTVLRNLKTTFDHDWRTGHSAVLLDVRDLAGQRADLRGHSPGSVIGLARTTSGGSV